MRRLPHLTTLLLASLVATPDACARADADADAEKSSDGGFFAKFRDPEDGRLDLSSWLIDRKGALPVPVFITEPAIGYGGGIALLYFRRQAGQPDTRTTSDGKVRPITPNLFGGVFAGTENGTRAAGAGASMHFNEDRWRYKGGISRMSVNLDYYLDTPSGGTRKIGYNVDGNVSLQQGQRRFGDDVYVGLRWLYVDFDQKLDIESDSELIDPRERSERSSGLGFNLEVDLRDNAFTPSSGWTGVVETTFFTPDLGSDTRYELYRGKAYGYLPVADGRLVLGGRVDVRAANGDVPFYMQPFVELRGIPAMRYQDRRTAVLETEARWNIDTRWALVGFIGAARAWGREHNFDEAGTAVAKGAGFRYLMARRMGLYGGLDVGWGPEERAFYVQVGSAWR